jgi:hypothetical protein
MVTWIILCTVMVGVFLGLDFIGDKISFFPTKESRSRAYRWLILIAFIVGEIYQVISERLL